eukprot:2403027-Pleurochrysis_carterae.AAC.3
MRNSSLLCARHYGIARRHGRYTVARDDANNSAVQPAPPGQRSKHSTEYRAQPSHSTSKHSLSCLIVAHCRRTARQI